MTINMLTVEEVVDFEEYMADADHPEGKFFTFDTADLNDDNAIFQNHPEVLSTNLFLQVFDLVTIFIKIETINRY